MHLTRPKSSKGRSRSTMNFINNTESNPQPHGPLISDNSGKIRSQSQPVMRHSSHLNQDQVLQQPEQHSTSLNKYKVLPSIQRGRPVHIPEAAGAEHEGRKELLDTPSPNLLLAIKEPGGGRFQQHFHPTDTLQMVKTSAEAKYGVKYGEVSIETMDVPRRTFTDMSMSLSQCGIPNKSVLCIFVQVDD